jgi:hypothetical protein
MSLSRSFESFIQESLEKNIGSLLDVGSKSVFGENNFRSSFKNSKEFSSMSPECSVLIKKKAFSTLNFNNDLKWMDTTEKFLLRATKALFAYKVQQIRSYEALTKYNNFANTTGDHNLFFLYNVFNDLNLLTVDVSEFEGRFEEILKKAQREKINRQSIGAELKDVAELARRFAFSGNYNLTTWHIDPESQEDLVLGPGTGVIELASFSSLTTSTSLDSSPSTFNLTMEDPLNLSTITEDDIEFAIEEAIFGAHDFFSKLVSGSLEMMNYGKKGGYRSDINSFSKRFNESSKNTLNSDASYLRERLRVFYLGKPFVNPADGVHVYMCSNKGRIHPSKSSESSSVFKEKEHAWSPISYNEEYQIDEIVLEAERRLYSSGKLTLDEYKDIRSNIDNSFKMMHVYAGVVSSASTRYSSGKYDFSFSASDNMGWLQWSTYQKVPALEDLTGVLEDPFTPYKIDTDEFGDIIEDGAPELLDENKELLENNYLSYNSGILKGQQASEGNLYQGQFNGFGSLDKTKILQHPDGFIYRWKRGIMTATASVQSASESGSGARNNKLFSQRYGITPADDILSGLDVANIISVLITGQPYNIETFLERSFEATTSNSAGSNKLGREDPLSFLVHSIKKQNSYYGNFKPYRTVTVNKKTVSRSIQDKIKRDNLNSNIVSLQKRKVRLIRQREDMDGLSDSSRANPLISIINDQILEIDSSIQGQIGALKNTNFGNIDTNLTFNFSFGDKSEIVSDLNEEDEEKVTRAMLHVGSLRRIEDVRLNRDNNYLVVSDQYDFNLELTPFLLRLSQTKYKKFQGDYTNVFDRCKSANNAIGFEFFANTQGHIEFRPPQWNRTPQTILEYASKSKRDGKPVIPENIMSLFSKRIDGLEYEIQKLNILITMSALLLGRFPDKFLIPGYPGINGPSSLAFYGIKLKIQSENGEDGTSKFKNFVSGSDAFAGAKRSATLLDDTLKVDFDPAGGKVSFGNTTSLMGEFDAIAQEYSGIFNSVVERVRSKSGGAPRGDASKYANADSLNIVRDDSIKFVGFDPSKSLGLGARKIQEDDFILNRTGSGGIEDIIFGKGDGEGLFKKLSVFVSSRDRLVNILNRNKDRKKELEAVETFFQGNEINPREVDNKVLERTINLINSANEILKGSPFDGNVFEHLILNDNSNILGYGSGKRFLIDDVDIISASYSEKPPDFTRINVVGDVPLDVAQAANSATDGLYYWAGASDFDLWRQYGYKPLTMNSVPFLNDAENACKPFAYFKMQTQRAKIMQGSVTLTGNEFYQPGDVVYVKSKHLLYYVNSVAHTFTIGQSFTTTLSLSYGHAPGEYLPGPLDVIGQQLYTNPLKDKVITQRNLRGDDNYRVLNPGSIVMPPNKISTAFTGNDFASKRFVLNYADNQTRFMRMLSDTALLISSKRKLLLRAFISSKPSESTEGSDAVKTAKAYLDVVKGMFMNPEIVVKDDVGEISASINNIEDVAGKLVSSIKKSTFGELQSFNLPNGAQAKPVSEEDIIIQVSYLKKDKVVDSGDNTNKNSSSLNRNNKSSRIKELPELGIQCFDRDLINFLTDKEGDIRDDAKRIFPMGGPSQATWLDARTYGLLDGKKGVVGVIEIGIIDLGDNQ